MYNKINEQFLGLDGYYIRKYGAIKVRKAPYPADMVNEWDYENRADFLKDAYSKWSAFYMRKAVFDHKTLAYYYQVSDDCSDYDKLVYPGTYLWDKFEVLWDMYGYFN